MRVKKRAYILCVWVSMDATTFFIKCRGGCGMTKASGMFDIGMNICKDCSFTASEESCVKVKSSKKITVKSTDVTKDFFGVKTPKVTRPNKKKATPQKVETDSDVMTLLAQTAKSVNEWERHANKKKMMDCKKLAEDAGVIWDLEDYVAAIFINNPCSYSGLTGHNWLARLDHAAGFYEYNTVPCDQVVEAMRGKLRNEVFIKLCNDISMNTVEPLSSKLAMSMATRFDKCLREHTTFKRNFKEVCQLVSEKSFR